MDKIIGKLSGGGRIAGHLSGNRVINGSVNISSIAPYTGAYEADALFTEQVFPTRNKRMTDDFTVHAINYTEAPNDWGTTVTIGG